MGSTSKDIKFAINAQEQTLNSIKSLQNLEKRLYENLEKVSTSGKDKDLQRQIVNKINDISQTKIVLFDQLQSMYISAHSGGEKKDHDLSEQLKIVSVVEKQLKDSKSKSEVYNNENINNIRQIEINTYYTKKYKAYYQILQIIVITCIPLIILSLLGKFNVLSNQLLMILGIVVIIPGAIIIIQKMVNISSRDNMDFDRFNINLKQNKKDYPKEKKDKKDKKDQDDDFGFDSSGLGCYDESCCGDGLKFDKKKSICVIAKGDK